MDDRKGFIGSSEISTVLNLNPFQTPLELWAEKTGQILPKDLSNNESVEWGKRLEKVVSSKFSEKHNVKLIAYKKRFVHPEYDFLTCELDNIIANTDEMVEIKTCSAWNYKYWENPDDIPFHYICQVMFALGLSNRKIGHIAVLIGGQRYLEKRIEFDKKIFDEMVRKAVYFWNTFIIPKAMPTTIKAMDDEVLFKLYPEGQESEIELTDEANRIVESIEGLQSDLNAVEKQIDEQKNILKSMLKDSEIGKTDKFIITWKNQETKRLDTALLKEKNIDIYNQYSKITKSRVFKIKNIKEKENE